MNKIIKSILFTIILEIFYSGHCQAKLRLVNVIFRSGDRTPDNNDFEKYPIDPYINYPFKPEKLGGLTNKGKLREFQLGTYIRKLYGDFLGNIYYPSQVYARSTNVDRTKMSLQLVLASLYPPKSSQKWNFRLPWQPTSTHYVPTLDDNLMLPDQCPRYLKARERVQRLPEVVNTLNFFNNLMSHLSLKTGKSISSSVDMLHFYNYLMALKASNLQLPSWTQEIFPQGKLLDGANLEYELASYTEEMKKLNGGMLLRKIVGDMLYAKHNPSISHKLYLYSGHAKNVVAVLKALGVYIPHVPEYSSAVFVEFHDQEDGEFYVKIKYYKGISKKGKAMLENITVPGCVENCSFDSFLRALKHVIPFTNDTQCDKRSLHRALGRKKIELPRGITKPILDAIQDERYERSFLH